MCEYHIMPSRLLYRFAQPSTDASPSLIRSRGPSLIRSRGPSLIRSRGPRSVFCSMSACMVLTELVHNVFAGTRPHCGTCETIPH